MLQDVKKLVILDGQRLFRTGLKMILSSSNFPTQVVGEASCAKDLWDILSENLPDVLLIDASLTDRSSADVITEVKENYPDMKILVITSDLSPKAVAEINRTGVSGFISKNASYNEFVTALEYVTEGDEYFGRDIMDVLKKCNEKGRTITGEEFTNREVEIITLSAQGLPAKRIAEQLGISLKTVFAHKYNIFKKIGINNSVELTNYAYKKGLVKL